MAVSQHSRSQQALDVPEPDWSRYLDHATTAAPRAPGVAERMAAVLSGVCASPARSSHLYARNAAELVRGARNRVAGFFGCDDPNRVIFTAGVTTALNQALKGLLRAGDHVVATSFDHNSVLRPLMRLRHTGVRVTIVRRRWPDDEFVAAVRREIRPQTRLVVVNHASNVLGCVLPYDAIGAAAHAVGALVLLDTAQTAGHVPIDLGRSSVDVLAFSGHKTLLGPPGIGGLVIRTPMPALTPVVDGGTGYLSENLEPSVTFPTSFEAGTQNTPAIAALDTALSFLSETGCSIYRTAAAVRRRCADQLRTLRHVEVFEPPDETPMPIVSFRLVDVAPRRVAAILDSRFGIQVRAGLHCAPLVHESFGTASSGGTVRASFGYGSTEGSADLLCEAIATIAGEA